MPSLRSSDATSNSPGPSRTVRTRQRLSPCYTMLGPLLNGDLMPPEEEKVDGNTWGLYFARGASISERKRFPSYLRLRSHSRFIDVEDGFGFDTFGDHIYKIKVIVDDRRYFVAGTYDQSSRECNMALQFYGCSEKLKGDLVIFSLSKYQPERFLETFPRFKNAEEKQECWTLPLIGSMSWTTHQLATSDDTNGSDFHAVIDTDVFTCLSRRHHDFPRVPSRSDTLNPSPNAPTLPDFYTPRWTTLFILYQLNESARTVILEAIPKTDWDSLERNMRAFLRGCMKVNRLNIPEDFQLWPYPNFYMYHAVWRTEVDARRAAMRSRQAFIPLIACISFYLRLLYHLESKWVDIIAQASRVPYQEPSAFLSKRQQEYERLRQEPAPSKWEWQQRLQRETSIAPEWLAYFHQIMDIPMVGHTWTYIILDVCLASRFSGGQNALDVVLGYRRSLVYTQEHLGRGSKALATTFIISGGESFLRGRIFRSSSATSSYHWRSSTSNEDLFAFIKRRDERRLKAIASETTLEHQSRLQREDNARRDRPPGRKGARVYYWDLVEGTRVRTARRYDSVADEWDICTDLDPHDGPDHDDLDSDDDYDAYFMSVNSEMNEEGDHNVGAASSDAFLIRLHRSNDLPPASIQFLEPVEDTAYHRLAFSTTHARWARAYHLTQNLDEDFGSTRTWTSSLPQGPDDQTKLQLSARTSTAASHSFEVDAVSSYNGVWFLIQAREARDNEAFSIGLRSAATVMEMRADILRDDFLRSARGRAALLAGGIVARLARDAVNEQDVYDGPTENALQEGEHVLCVWEEGKHFALWMTISPKKRSISYVEHMKLPQASFQGMEYTKPQLAPGGQDQEHGDHAGSIAGIGQEMRRAGSRIV
ncbi:hypothetical protein DFJ43DRAFT_1160738 [Lentinula guzmanii]|uniref:Uncharacterized protein n=1 Tax=Lentinula guzmanii TaxID=2804957 RepID=A0AA38J2U6_9AGAR|nr:hypothetical protein DFJ43DRAFT_1160738 [Lentinula guzmanii]